MAKEHRNVCLVNTVYSFFLYLLIKGYDENDIYIFNGWFPREVSRNVRHIQNPKVSFKDGAKMYPTDSIKGILLNIAGYCRYFYGYIRLRILFFIKTFNKDIDIYGHAQSPFSFIFYEHENCNIIEDGLINYTPDLMETHKVNPIIDKFLHLCGIYFLNAKEAFGTHKNIKTVYLTQKYSHPLIEDKIKIIDIEKTWNKLSENEKNEILRIMNINPSSFNFEGKTALILTQPLADGNLATFEEEIQMYQEIIDKFDDYTVIIKPHPREEYRDYKNIFKNVEVINGYFPIELLDLIGIKPTVACSIVSTALLNFKDSEIYVYEGELKNKRLKESRDNLIALIKNNYQR